MNQTVLFDVVRKLLRGRVFFSLSRISERVQRNWLDKWIFVIPESDCLFGHNETNELRLLVVVSVNTC